MSFTDSTDQFLPCGDARLSRRFATDQKRVYRCRRVEVGPNLCQRRVDPNHSFPNARQFIDTDGAPKICQKHLRRVVPSLAVSDPLNLPNFGVPYSMNRDNRWELPELFEEQIANFQDPSRELRVSAVVQRCNPLQRAASLNGRSMRHRYHKIGRMDEECVTELHTFDAGAELHRHSGTARGANTLAQLMQKGPRPKKKRNRRAKNGQNEEQTEQQQRWLDLFEPKDYAKAVNPHLGTTSLAALQRNRDTFELPPLHNYYTFRMQNATRHQLNSGWGARTGHRHQLRPLTRAEVREDGRWATRAENNGLPIWEQISKRQMALQGSGDVVYKRRGVPCAKGAQRFALESELEECLVPEERVLLDDNGTSESEFDAEDDEIGFRNGHLSIGDFIVPSRKQKKQEQKNVPSDANSDVENEYYGSTLVGQSRQSISSSSSSGLGDDAEDEDEDDDEDESELWQMPAEFGAIIDRLRECGELTPFGNELAGSSTTVLPSGTTVFRLRGQDGHLMVELNGEPCVFQPGSLFIIRKGATDSDSDGGVIRYFVNEPNPFTEAEDSSSSEPSASSSSTGDKTVASNKIGTTFLGDLYPARCFVQSEKLRSEEEADQRAVHEVFDRVDELHPCCSSSVVVSASSADDDDLFCGVCFAECSAVDGFSLPRCRHHFFCDRCWRQHIHQCLAIGHVPIPCMATRCSTVLHPDCTLLVVSQPVAHAYHRALARTRRMCRDFIVCGQCHCALHLRLQIGGRNNNGGGIAQQHQLLTRCAGCAETLCTRCAQRQHVPLSCAERDLYEQILQSNGQSLRSLMLNAEARTVSGVRCRNCNNLVEKNTGCNHMSCRCGHQFCWHCGNDWKSHRGCTNGANARINVPLFDLVFVRGPDGKRVAKAPEKFFAKFFTECAELRALRCSRGRRLHKRMRKIFPDNASGWLEARQWTEKYLQLSEFVELCLVRRLLLGAKNNSCFGSYVDQLRFTFGGMPFLDDAVRDKKLVELSGEEVRSCYAELLSRCRKIMGIRIPKSQ